MKTMNEKLFWSRVAKGDGCWLWLGSKNQYGYGRYSAAYAHRIAWALTHGFMPGALSVLHRCDNPPCVNPEHLFLGMQADNMRDCVEKGRLNVSGNPPRGEAQHMAKLSDVCIGPMVSCYRAGVEMPTLSRWFGVSHGAVYAACARRTWKHVTIEAP